eukprot:3551810-Rhodomonas_salina.2
MGDDSDPGEARPERTVGSGDVDGGEALPERTVGLGDVGGTGEARPERAFSVSSSLLLSGCGGGCED